MPIPPGDQRRGTLLRRVESGRTSWVCRVVRSRDDGGAIELAPYGGFDAPSLRLAERDSKGAREGDRVLVIPLETKSGAASKKRGRDKRSGRSAESNRRSQVSVRVVEILGPAGDPEADHRALVWKHRLPERFSRRARIEAEAIDADIVGPVAKERLDLRHLPFVTIDPATARDHDDAIFAEERAPEGIRGVARDGEVEPVRTRATWARRLWVAIADVSHFVLAGGFIDAEARRRANSFYFPDRSIPMLPERLSSDLCSLVPDVDRLALVVEMRIGSDGVVLDALFHEAVIRSQARLAYEEAADWLAEPGEAVPSWGSSLRCLDRIATDFEAARRAAGALALDLPEISLVLDETGRATDARLRTRNRAHILIEEAMLAANRVVARALDRAEHPTIHRVHAPPPPSKMDELVVLLESLGVELRGEIEAPGVLASALEAVAGTPSEERVHLAVLRSMSQARYEAESAGHYALRFEHYLHFTSPIRRYADLEAHRALRRLIRGEGPSAAGDGQAVDRMTRLGIWLSARERVAQEAEREAVALASCALMQDRFGERLEAEVTGVTEFGLFVRLVSPCVSGLIPMRELEGRWEVDETEEALVADRSGARIALGERLRVRLVSVDVDRARLSFRIDQGQRKGKGRDKRRPG
jgi:ribonuclease R